MSQKLVRSLVIIISVVGILAILSQFIVYVVDQRELAVVKRFGEPVRAATEPGLYFKMPIVETVETLPSTLQFWGDSSSEKLPDLPTKDNKKIEIVPWAVWRINDPIAFVKRMVTLQNAENRVAQFTRGAMRDVITKFDLEDLVRSTDRQMKMAEIELDDQHIEEEIGAKPKKAVVGRERILAQINVEATKSLKSNKGGDEAAASRGIELVDIGISHVDFVTEVRRTTFERWISEREAISTRNIQQGEERKQQILNATKRETEKIQGEGQKEASEIRGKADAEVIKRYAQAISQMGEFYTFVRTLDAYKKSFNSDTELVLTTDNDFLKQLQAIGEAKIQPSMPPSQLDQVMPVAAEVSKDAETTGPIDEFTATSDNQADSVEPDEAGESQAEVKQEEEALDNDVSADETSESLAK